MPLVVPGGSRSGASQAHLLVSEVEEVEGLVWGVSVVCAELVVIGVALEVPVPEEDLGLLLEYLTSEPASDEMRPKMSFTNEFMMDIAFFETPAQTSRTSSRSCACPEIWMCSW